MQKVPSDHSFEHSEFLPVCLELDVRFSQKLLLPTLLVLGTLFATDLVFLVGASPTGQLKSFLPFF